MKAAGTGDTGRAPLNPRPSPSKSPACQAAFVRNGGLSLLYRCAPTCPLPILRWLFQVSHRRKRVPPPPAVTPRSPLLCFGS